MSASVGLLAITVSAAGIGLLRASWGRRYASASGERAAWIAAGWSALACATLLWSAAAGPGRGVALTLLTTALLGLGVVAHTAVTGANGRGRRHRGRDTLRDRSRTPRAKPGLGRLLRGAGVFALAGPVAGTAAYLLAVPLYAALEAIGTSGADRLAVLVFFVPLAWAALAVVATIDLRPTTRAAWIGGTSAAAVLGALVVGAELP